VIRTKELH